MFKWPILPNVLMKICVETCVGRCWGNFVWNLTSTSSTITFSQINTSSSFSYLKVVKTFSFTSKGVCFLQSFEAIFSDFLPQLLAIRHSVDRALPALPALPALSALLDLQFLQLSQLFQLSQFCQFFHSSDALSSPSSSNFEIENWKSLWNKWKN